jgi:hypothetical protein
MARNGMIATARSSVDRYLGELAALLRGPRQRRTRILTEVRDGLEHAVQNRVASGVPLAAAEQEAIAEFGTPHLVAAAFGGELGTAYARRTITLYVVTGPLVGIWWLLLRQPQPWRTGLIALLVAIPVLPLVGAVIATAATTLATTGRLIRWVPEASPRRAVGGVLAVASLVLATDTTIIATYVRSGVPWRPLAVVAVGASLVRIVCGVRVLRGACLIWRATAAHDPVPPGGSRARQ